jgi:hypothetical protein
LSTALNLSGPAPDFPGLPLANDANASTPVTVTASNKAIRLIEVPPDSCEKDVVSWHVRQI